MLREGDDLVVRSGPRSRARLRRAHARDCAAGSASTVCQGGPPPKAEPSSCPTSPLEPRFCWAWADHGIQSAILIPLQGRERLIGMLEADSDRLNDFPPEDIVLLEALASSWPSSSRTPSYSRLNAAAAAALRRSPRSPGRSRRSWISRSSRARRPSCSPSASATAASASCCATAQGRRVAGDGGGQPGCAARPGRRSPAHQRRHVRAGRPHGADPAFERHQHESVFHGQGRTTRRSPRLDVPIKVGGRVLGVLGIESDKVNAFTRGGGAVHRDVGRPDCRRHRERSPHGARPRACRQRRAQPPRPARSTTRSLRA